MADIRYVYDFAEGSREQKDLLGGKGANQAVACAHSSWAAAVACTPCRLRINSLHANHDSSTCICRLIAPCVTPNSCAAAV
mgnify:CR=1 FL=1